MKTAIVDYGMGNLHSVLKSVQAAQALSGKAAEIYLTDRPEDILAADKIIFPGQGAMPDCMAALRQSGLGEAVEDGLKNKPFFGICVGAQLLFEHSEEGDTAGLGWFKGRVKRFAANQTDAHGGRARTGADICPQTQCAGFVQPCVDGIHLIEQVIHMTRTDFTEPAFQTDEGITAAPIGGVAFG